ncbi:MAG: hypothetical protein ACE363_02110 [Alphaproteobacteria bacterium]
MKQLRRLTVAPVLLALSAFAASAQDTNVEVNPPAQGPWTAPQVCFLDGKAFSINAQVCNQTRGSSGNRLLECRKDDRGGPASWAVIGNVC